MGELHVFKYVCPKDGWFSTKYWDIYTGHVANHVRDKELENSWLVPKGLKQRLLWKLQMGRCWAVNELTKEVTDIRPKGQGDLPRPRKVFTPLQLPVDAAKSRLPTQYFLIAALYAEGASHTSA